VSNIHLFQGKAVLQFILRPTDEYEADLTIWISILSVLVHIVSCENMGFEPNNYLGGFDSDIEVLRK
jgi:hypothetical protein